MLGCERSNYLWQGDGRCSDRLLEDHKYHHWIMMRKHEFCKKEDLPWYACENCCSLPSIEIVSTICKFMSMGEEMTAK